MKQILDCIARYKICNLKNVHTRSSVLDSTVGQISKRPKKTVRKRSMYNSEGRQRREKWAENEGEEYYKWK